MHVDIITAADATAEGIVLDDRLALEVELQVVLLCRRIAALALHFIVRRHAGLAPRENVAATRDGRRLARILDDHRQDCPPAVGVGEDLTIGTAFGAFGWLE